MPVSSGAGRKTGAVQSLLLSTKNLLWRVLPKDAGMKMVNFYFRLKKFRKQKWMNLVVYIVGRCNLNCVSCYAFAPIADDDVLDPASFESDCRRLSELGGDKIREIVLQGGEPLLHPQLKEIMSIARSYFPKARIKIVTNGILLLKQDESFWECCRSTGAYIAISPYPIKLDMDAIENVMRKYGLCMRRYSGGLPWGKMAFDLNGGYDPRDNYKKCTIALRCPTLQNGKVTTCLTISTARYFNKYFQKNLEVFDTDAIDIYKVKSMDEILEFIAKPVSFCRYCNVNIIPIEWGKSKREVSEWT
jgi:hypothetical protein